MMLGITKSVGNVAQQEKHLIHRVI